MVPIKKLTKGLRVESQLLFCGIVIKSYMYCDPVERLVGWCHWFQSKGPKCSWQLQNSRASESF